MGFFIHVTVSCGLMAMLSLGLMLIVRSGVYSVASAGFYLVGAYCTALGTLKLGLSPGFALVLGAVLGAILGIFCIAPAYRVREDRLLILTLGFAESLRLVCANSRSVTNGAMGLSGIPHFSLLGVNIKPGTIAFAGFVWLIVGIICLLLIRLVKSPWGLRIDAARDDRVAATSLGIQVARPLYIVHAAGASLAAVAGSLYAHHMAFVSPAPFTVVLSVFALCALLLGGKDSVTGVLLGAILIGAGLPLLQLVGTPEYSASAIRQIVFGVALAVLTIWLPGGIGGIWRGAKSDRWE